jgi:xylan 1,4-beta-xylosidase
MKFSIRYCFLFCILFSVEASTAQQKTFCNPINLDYGYTPLPNYVEWAKHRTTADPSIVNYKGDYYLFATHQMGYWWSSDMLNWNFISKKFLRPWNVGLDDLCASAVGVIGDTMVVFGSTYTKNFTLWMSTNPKANEWKPLIDSFEIGGWDPAFFTDTDGKFYMYNGSSNRYPIQGVELDRKTFKPISTRKDLFSLDGDRYGWHRFGENMDNTFIDPFLEGAWMTKHNNKYYLQYAAPGTEFSGYADGVLVGSSPLGIFTQQSDPFSFRPGGFVHGSGHGSTFQDNENNYWHISTSVIAVKHGFERRLAIWPTDFDRDGVMVTNTAFGDYPQYLPPKEKIIREIPSMFQGDKLLPSGPGWMLLNYKKPVLTSSTYGSYNANNAVDENIKTYWCAASAKKGEWLQTDLGNVSTVNAIQINYADQDVEFMGKPTGLYHQYKLYYSIDGKKWNMLIDKSTNKKDVPHDYVELTKSVQARYIKLENIHMPTGKFAISGLRVFGNGNGTKPNTVKQLMVLRTEKDKRSAWVKWSPVDNAFAYNIYFGTAPDKLYSCIMVHDNNDYWVKSMDKMKTYYYCIEAINENGVGEKSIVIRVD